MKGGVGKTTLTVNIAHFLSERSNKRVLIIDIDPQFNSTQCLFSVDEYVEHVKAKNDTIVSIFDDVVKTNVSTIEGIKEEKARLLADINPVKINDNLHILPGNLELYKLNMASGSGRENRLKQYLKRINKKMNYDYVLIDTPPTPSVWMTSALIASHYYLIPVKPDPMSFVGIDLLETIIISKRDAFDLSIKCIGLIFTMVERDDSIMYRQALKNVKENKKWKKYYYKKYIPKRAEIAKFQLNKQFILDTNDSIAKLALTGVVNELEKRIEDENNKK